MASSTTEARAADGQKGGRLTSEELVTIASSIGTQLRLRRILLGVSQETVSRRLGVDFQQLQKYELGQNRLSGADLRRLSSILQVPVSYFFETVDGDPEAARQAYQAATAADEETGDLMGRRKTVELIRAFYEDERASIGGARPAESRDTGFGAFADRASAAAVTPFVPRDRPKADKCGRRHLEKGSPCATETPAETARILVIDDDPTIRSLVSALLEARGHAVLAAADGLAGMRLFEEHEIDLVVTDIVMPELEGIATISAIRRLDPAVPILAISGSHTVGRYGDYLHAAETLGATATLPKPLAPDRFLEMIGRLLELAK